MPNTLPDYTRKVPPEWSGLRSIATELAPAGMPYDRIPHDHIYALREQVGQYPDEKLAELQYYGLGVGMRPFAYRLSDAATRNDVVQAGAAGLVRAYQAERSTSDAPPGLRIEHLALLHTKCATIPLALETTGTLSTPDRLLSSTLSATVWARRCIKQGDIPNELRIMSDICNGVLVGHEIGTLAMAGVLMVMQTSLFMRRMWREQPPKTPVHHIADDSELRRHLDPKTAAGFATLHSSTFLHSFKRMDHTTLDAAGNAQFLKVPQPADEVYPPLEPDLALHTEALTCPALQVRGLLPLITATVPEMIIHANRQILGMVDNPGKQR